MEGVSAVISYEMAVGEDRALSEARVLTSVVVCERTGVDAATVELCGAGGEGPYYQLRLPPGGTLAFRDAVALPWGLKLLCQAGEVTISLGWR